MKNIDLIKKEINKYYTPYVTFKVFDLTDMFFLHEASKETEFTNFLLWESLENIQSFYNNEKKIINYNEEKNLIISILEIKSGTWIGLVKLIPYKDGYTLSLWISKSFFGTKYSLNSASTLITILFNEMEFEKIYALTSIKNTLMLRIFNSYNFTDTQEIISLTHHNGGKVDCFEFIAYKNKFKMNNNYFTLIT